MATFEDGVNAVLGEAINVSNQRGGEYGDSWADQNIRTSFTDSVLRLLGVTEASITEKRLLLLAALCDVKISRMLGPWKSDTTTDLINYLAVFQHERDKYSALQVPEAQKSK